jgi:hypothetical protein
MSQDQTTQTTKSTLSKASKKGKSDLPDLDAVKEVSVVTPEDIAPILEQKDIKKFEAAQMGMAEFEAQVQLALKTGHHWLEVPKEVLVMVCGGEYPDTHYICYKGLKVRTSSVMELSFIGGILALSTTTMAVLLIWTNYFWMKHTQTLVNKVMSQNYRDYAVGVNKETVLPRQPKVQEQAPEDLRALQEFNFN